MKLYGSILMGLGITSLMITCTNPETASETAYLHPARLALKPTIEAVFTKGISALPGPRFTFLPTKNIFQHPNLTSPILEEALHFQIQTRLESLGYMPAATSAESDFLLAVDGSCDYSSPRPTSGFNGGAVYGSRNYLAPTWTEAPVPLQRPQEEDPQLSYAERGTVPMVQILAFDARSGKQIWRGFAVGSAENFDLRIADQLLLDRLIKKLSPTDSSCLAHKLHQWGGEMEIYTIDGGNYWPVVTAVQPGSEAEKRGVKAGDVLLSLNGISTRNQGLARSIGVARSQKPANGGTKGVFWRRKRSVDQTLAIPL